MNLPKLKSIYFLEFFLLTISTSFFCTDITGSSWFYNPPVIFEGFINNDQVTMTGNINWKNTCKMVDDTIRMYFYSDNFYEKNQIRYGDLLRIDLYPGNDLLIGTRQVLLHLVRYYDAVSSYTISPVDTLYNSEKVEMRAQKLIRRSGEEILLDSITVCAMPIVNGSDLSIVMGTISGTIQ